MKKYIFLLAGISIFVFGVSAAHAQLAVGDRVQTTVNNLNVRDVPGGLILGYQQKGALGTIIGGPKVAPVGTSPTSTLYKWWNVDYDTKPDGWSIVDYLIKVSTSTGSNCGDVNKNGSPDAFDLSLIINVVFSGATTTYVTDVNGSGATDVLDMNEEINYLFSGGPEPTGCRASQPSADLSVTGSIIGFASNRIKTTVDDIALIQLVNSSNHTLALNTLGPSFQGTAPAATSFLSGVSLINNATNVAVGTPIFDSAPCNGFSICQRRFSFGSGNSGFVLAPYSAAKFRVRINSTLTPPDQAGVAQTLSASIWAGADVSYTDLTTGQSGLGIKNTPIVLASIAYIAGSSGNQPPTNLVISGPTSVVVGVSSTAPWSFVATDPEGGKLTYSINWGDGSPILSGSNILSGWVWNWNYHTYLSTGIKTITFTATDDKGAFTNATLQVQATSAPTNQPPVINSFTGPTGLTVGQGGTWNAFATDPEGGNLFGSVSWGDGSASTTFANIASGGGLVFQHSYSLAGTFYVSYVVCDTNYACASRTLTVTTASSTSSSITPILPKTYPAKTLAPVINQAYPSAPYSASALESIRIQINSISEQLKLLLLQIGQ